MGDSDPPYDIEITSATERAEVEVGEYLLGLHDSVEQG